MGIKENAFAYIDAHRSEMLKMWEELVSIDSGSDYKPGVRKCRQYAGKRVWRLQK